MLDSPPENFQIKIFYERKFDEKLVLELKFNAEHIEKRFKVVWKHLNALKVRLYLIFFNGR